MIVQYKAHTALLFQNIMKVNLFTKIANRKDFEKFRFNVHATTLKKTALETRKYCHTILNRHTILQALLRRTISIPVSHVFE